MPVETELYELLGVSPDSSPDDIKKAYKKKAKEHHPDKNINDPDAGQKFQEMAAAYEILNDPDAREVYDRHGMDGLSKGAGGGGDPNDMFAQFFAQSGMFGFDFGAPPRRSKGENTTVPYEVTLEDLYNGKTVKMNMEKEAVCSHCHGSGARGNAKPKQCSTCDGKGWTTVTQATGSRDRMHVARQQCRDCKGAGERLKEKERCKKCKGQKVVTEKNRQEIHIERGSPDRHRIVLRGAGDEYPGIPPGDVTFLLKTQKHESFERIGDDLITHVTITLSEALLGFDRILVSHLDGRGIKVSSPPGKVIKPQETIILRGEGMPIYKRPDDKGDMHVILTLEMPDDQWLKTIDLKALASLLPPKKKELEPLPAIVDEVPYEESDIGDLRSSFLDHEGFEGQFDEHDSDWSDEDDDEDGEPECRPQ
ncbi:DnaJ-domain-containing protein [Ephemerocybe angulata]|uniref:DnaJ-domain-containing protein n=1 Tax=Ephemerocybe angulata TaxID=980116 RepID=A0A8H6M706_9AGAR|nr:DnaJ-domain-containing protein [Tulosesus angulatus]